MFAKNGLTNRDTTTFKMLNRSHSNQAIPSKILPYNTQNYFARVSGCHTGVHMDPSGCTYGSFNDISDAGSLFVVQTNRPALRPLSDVPGSSKDYQLHHLMRKQVKDTDRVKLRVLSQLHCVHNFDGKGRVLPGVVHGAASTKNQSCSENCISKHTVSHQTAKWTIAHFCYCD